MASKPDLCCRLLPEIFTDIKSESKERMWVVACSICGKYADAHSEEDAVTDWNLRYREQNPRDKEFIQHLRAVDELFNPPKPLDIPKRTKRNFACVLNRDGHICQYCGVDMSGHVGDGVISVDHIHPVCGGGGNQMYNLVVACMTCNLIAGGRAFKSFSKKREYILQQRKAQNLFIYS